MQTVLNLIHNSFENLKVTKKENFRMTSRDMDILEFILEMKFSTIEDIHSKFFKFTRTGQQSICLRWARERVAHLVKADFLKPVKDVCYRTLYIVTQKGYFFLRNSRMDRIYSRPLLSVDGRTYNHDQKVIQIRTQLEENGLVTSWTSERQLAEIEEFKKYLPTEFRPDAIYEAKDGHKVAFELEIARKSKERYQQKIKRYIQLITDHTDRPIFSKVHFVCEKQTVLDLIQDQAALFQTYFQFDLLSSVLKQERIS
jgi:hypothetical protein